MATRKRKMMMRIIIRRGIILAVICIVLGGIWFAATGFTGALDEEIQGLNGDIQQNRSRTAQLNQLITDSGLAGEVYKKLSENRDTMEFTIARKMLADVVGPLNSKYLLDELNISLQPAVEFKHSELGATSREALSIDFTLTFNALGDHLVYAFVEELQRSAPGFVVITNLKIEKLDTLSLATLAAVSKGRFVNVVSAEVSARWYGYREEAPVEPSTDTEATP